jgi:hypothetical protein
MPVFFEEKLQYLWVHEYLMMRLPFNVNKKTPSEYTEMCTYDAHV